MQTLLTLAAVSLPLVLLTGYGAHVRGVAVPPAVLAGVLFPVTWAVWYVRDEHPYHRTRHRAG